VAAVAIGIAIGLVPWLWFVLRDHLGELGDMIGLGLPVLAAPTVALLAIGRVWVRWRVVLAWMVSWALVFALGVFGPRLPDRMDDPVDPVTLVTANVRFDNRTPELAAADVLAEDADVVVVPEATRSIVAPLAARYEHVQRTDDDFSYGVAVFSHLPLTAAERLDIGNGVLRVEVAGPRPFVLYAAHLSRPVLRPRESTHVSHAENYQQVQQLAAVMQRESLPVVLAGDLNLSDRARGYRLLADDLTDVARSSWAGTTYLGGVYRVFLLRIDHLFASPGWCGERAGTFTITGSDHHGVRADVGECG